MASGCTADQSDPIHDTSRKNGLPFDAAYSYEPNVADADKPIVEIIATALDEAALSDDVIAIAGQPGFGMWPMYHARRLAARVDAIAVLDRLRAAGLSIAQTSAVG